MDGALLLNVVVHKGSFILELLATEDKSLRVKGDSFFVLDLDLQGFDCVGLLNINGVGLAGESFHEDLHILKSRVV